MLNAFMGSRAPVSMIMGPLGSGKTYGAVQRLLGHMQEQEPNAEGIRPTRFVAVRNCYDDETEILTEQRGWQLFRDLEPQDRVAQLGTSGELEWVTPSYHYAEDYDGELIGYEGEGVNFRVTPDHKLYVSEPRGRAKVWDEYHFALARDLYGKRLVRFQRDAAPWKGYGNRSTPWTPAFYRWLGLWFAEGSSGVYPCADGYTRHQCVIVQKYGLDHIHQVFQRAGLPYTVSTRRDGTAVFRLSATPEMRWLIEKLSEVGHSTDKRLPQWVKDAPGEHLGEFIEGYIDGDGSRGRVTVAYTSSRQLADDLQELALKAGRVANISSRDRRGIETEINGVPTSPTSEEYTVTFVGDKKYRPGCWSTSKKRYRGWYREHYKGRVYCVEVPTHIVYVRRNRKALWCSQTYPDLMSTTAKDFEAVFAPLGRMKYGGLEPPTFHVAFELHDGTHVRSQVIFLALDRPDAVKKLRGFQLTGAWLNEVKELVKPIIDMADLRVGRYPSKADGGVLPTWHGMFGDSNACDEDHWYFNLAEEQHPEGWEFYRQPGGVLNGGRGHDGKVKWQPNPEAENLANLPANYYTRGMVAKAEDWISVNLANEYGFLVEGLPVHPEYVDSVHTAGEVLEPDKREPLVIGVDFGRTPAASFSQFLPSMGRWQVVDELTTENMSASIFGPELKRKLDREYSGFRVQAWGDPAGDSAGQSVEDTPIQILRACGIPIAAAPSNVVTLRRAAVAGPATRMCMDGRPALIVSPKCRMIRKGLMGGFCFRRMKLAGEDRYTDEPDKNMYSHPVESLEYGLLGGGEGREAIRPKSPDSHPEERQQYADMD